MRKLLKRKPLSNLIKQTTIFTLLFVSFLSYAQTKTITGTITDTLKKPLESANIIAIPLEKTADLKFAIADNKGRFKLTLDANATYEVTASYLGFNDQVLKIDANSKLEKYDFVMVSTGEKLKEIIIKYDYKPIIVKKDTLIYDVKSFVNGNERKMKQVLEKLPGVEVDKQGNVTVQGKKVTQMLVENKSFFGGGSKLAVENIPADAIDKIEVLDHFTNVGFMKKVSDSDELAMNVKLKADKKKFVFGDIEAGAGVGFTKNHLLHTALFYYSPKTNLSTIADANNFGKSTFTFDDLMRFDGGVSSYLTGRKSLSNLFDFANDNRDVVQNKSNFAAFNFSHELSPKLLFSGYGLVSKVFMEAQNNTINAYLQGNTSAIENRFQNNTNKSALGIANFKLDYSPNKNSKLFYNFQYQATNNKAVDDLKSRLNNVDSNFEVLKNADNFSVKQFVEFHKNLSQKHTLTFVANHAFENQKPLNQWFSNQPFLTGQLPLVADNNYKVEQVLFLQNQSLDVLLKHYWIINNFNHLYTVFGNNFAKSRYTSAEKQLVSNGTVNDFTSFGFSNDVDYKLNDVYVGLEYKFKIGKLTSKPGVYLHNYDLATQQENKTFATNKTFLQPQLLVEYEFNQSESLVFNYKLSNTFFDARQMANGSLLQSYNSVFKGNALLENEQFHNGSLRYSKLNMYKGITVFANLNYNKKVKTLRNELQFLGINQFTTPVITNNPETNLRFMGSISKKIYRFNLKFTSNLSWFDYYQKINNIDNLSSRTNQDFELSLKTAYKKWPTMGVGYKKGFSQLKGISNNNFYNNGLNADFDHTFLKNWTFIANYENTKNINTTNQSNFFEVLNASLRFQKKDSPLTFELTAQNILNTQFKNNYTISDFVISEQTTFILPRVILLSMSYKL